jgi:hypothetical protein
MKERNEGFRKDQEQKHFKRRVKMFKNTGNDPSSWKPSTKNALKDHATLCSCDLCRNPRTSKHISGSAKKTKQEHIDEFNVKEQKEDLD